jgi:hypothetical protein
VKIILSITVYNLLYGCETWSLILKEEYKLVYENRVLSRFSPESKEVTGGRKKLHNEELHNFYSSNVVRVITSKRLR